MIRINEDATRIRRAIYGDYKGTIKSFTIITGENPLGVELKSGNKNRNKMLLDLAKQYGVKQYDTINGYFGGNTEHSYILYNLSLGESERLAAIFMQRSFFYGESITVSNDSLKSGNRDFRAKVSYYETDYNSDDIDKITTIDINNVKYVKYRFIESYNGVEIVEDELKFHSSKNSFMFTIPLNYFESTEVSQPEVVDIDCLNKCLDDRYTIHSRVQYRALAYNGKRLK